MVRSFLGLLALAWMFAQPATAANGLFTDQAPLHLTITTPFGALVSAAKYGVKPYPATVTLANDAGASQAFQIQLRARGHSRRTLGYCDFPPLLLTFDKKATHGSLFQGQKKLKLVTYCKTPPDYEQRIVLEYLVYKLYNQITPISLRVRAAEVTYRDSATDRGVTRFGFLIEDIHHMADRNQREVLAPSSHEVQMSQLDAHAATRVAMLEFMISNLDWEFLASEPGQKCCHNIGLLAAPGDKPATANAVVPTPFDFDSSGFVDAPYALPPARIQVNLVTDRYFYGYCAMSAEIPSVAQEYLARRAQMKTLIDSQPQLTPKFRDKTDRFMDGFFDILLDPARLRNDVVRHCH